LQDEAGSGSGRRPLPCQVRSGHCRKYYCGECGSHRKHQVPRVAIACSRARATALAAAAVAAAVPKTPKAPGQCTSTSPSVWIPRAQRARRSRRMEPGARRRPHGGNPVAVALASRMLEGPKLGVGEKKRRLDGVGFFVDKVRDAGEGAAQGVLVLALQDAGPVD
jgi:hypothetical protein